MVGGEIQPVKRINGVTWFWLALGGIAWLSVMFGGPSEEEQAQERARQAQVAQAEQDQKAKVIAEALRQREARVDAAIAKREVFIGMTRDEVIVSWGRPQASNVTLTARGKHEQLVYESNYLYLTDDVLTSIQSMN